MIRLGEMWPHGGSRCLSVQTFQHGHCMFVMEDVFEMKYKIDGGHVDDGANREENANAT